MIGINIVPEQTALGSILFSAPVEPVVKAPTPKKAGHTEIPPGKLDRLKRALQSRELDPAKPICVRSCHYLQRLWKAGEILEDTPGFGGDDTAPPNKHFVTVGTVFKAEECDSLYAVSGIAVCSLTIC